MQEDATQYLEHVEELKAMICALTGGKFVTGGKFACKGKRGKVARRGKFLRKGS